MKSLFISILLALSATIFAQIPSYVPSNGLVGWWPFNGNANDESGNGNNGTVNGATLTTDRFGVADKAYSFDGSTSHIDVQFSNSLNSIQTGITMSAWILMDGGTGAGTPPRIMELRGAYGNGGDAGLVMLAQDNSNIERTFEVRWHNNYGNTNVSISPTNSVPSLTWHHVLFSADGSTALGKFYVDGILLNTNANQQMQGVINACNYNNNPLIIGAESNLIGKWGGKLDDIGIWNRALTEAEIATLFAGCNLSVTTQPQDQSVNASAGTASFITASSSATATYQWQTNLGLGFQNLSNAGQYSGATSATLTVSNLSMSNNNQVFRCIINDSGCTDTTSEAVLTIIDDASIQSHANPFLQLYPNPVKDELFIKEMQEAVLPFEVYSTDGNKVLSGTTSGAIDVNALKKGSYQLKLKEQTIPFVKQ